MEIAVGSTHCSKEYQLIYQEWFNHIDSDCDGRITGSDTLKFFGLSNLSRSDLKQIPFFILYISNFATIWAIADSKRHGFLGFGKFVTAMQSGNAITSDLLNSGINFDNVQLPLMEGLDALLARKKRSPRPSEVNDPYYRHFSDPAVSFS